MNENGCAFPVQYDDGSYQQGMTLRDYFAAKAMAALLHPQTIAAQRTTSGTQYMAHEVPIAAYEIADAMIKARETTTDDL